MKIEQKPLKEQYISLSTQINDINIKLDDAYNKLFDMKPKQYDYVILKAKIKDLEKYKKELVTTIKDINGKIGFKRLFVLVIILLFIKFIFDNA